MLGESAGTLSNKGIFTVLKGTGGEVVFVCFIHLLNG